MTKTRIDRAFRHLNIRTSFVTRHSSFVTGQRSTNDLRSLGRRHLRGVSAIAVAASLREAHSVRYMERQRHVSHSETATEASAYDFFLYD
jgi:hypothetical protein